MTALRPRSRLVLSLLAAMMPLSAEAAQMPASSEKDIVIVGQRLKDALRQFVDSTTQTGPTDQIARWDGQICPNVIGIDPAQAEFMTRRIAEIAKTVHLRTGRSTCPTMLSIVFTTDAPALADAVARDFPSDNWTVRTLLKAFVGSTKPVRWISLADECGGGCGLPNSRLSKATAPTLRAMLIVIDAKRIGGFSIGEMSDYIAVVALSNPPLATKPPANSILSLFNAPTTAASNQLTDYDFSFLAGLYGTRLHFDAEAQRLSITARMQRELRRKPKDGQSQPSPRN